MNVKIICDSACDMPFDGAEKLGVKMVSLKTLIDGKEYKDGVDLKGTDFYELLKTCKANPSTSQVSPQEFVDAYEEIGEGSDILVITMSGKLSGTAQSAFMAAAECGRGRIQVVDSLNVSAGEQILLLYAIKLRNQGWDAKSIKAELDRVKNRISLVARLDTLEYLKRGGRISKTAAFAGTMLNIKPVLEVRDGEVKILGKARGEKQSRNMLNETIRKNGGVDYSMPVMLCYAGTDRTLLDAYIENSRELWEGKLDDLPVCVVGSTIGTHSGPGAVAVAFFKNE